EMGHVDHDESDQRDADGDDLRVPTLRAGHRDGDPEHDEKRAEETEPKRVQHDAGARAEQQVDARDGENEYQPDEAGQAGARQILSDVEVAKIFLEQAVEAQAGEPALELLRIRGAVAVRIEPMYVHTKNTGRKCQIR